MSIDPKQDKPNVGKDSAQHEDFWVEVIKTIGVAILLAFGMRQFVAEARFIPSGSMEPTLQVHDRLIVDKVSYRLGNPKRGDIIVFDPTDKLLQLNYKEAFIKRIIGLPGDKVTVINDKVTVNGKPLSENYTSGVHVKEMTEIYKKKREEKPEDPNNQIWFEGHIENSGGNWEGTVPANQYLVLGDHRSGSMDGRTWGYVPRDRIVGKALVRFWPLNRVGDIQPHPSYSPQQQK
jgi:signal peptidase I